MIDQVLLCVKLCFNVAKVLFYLCFLEFPQHTFTVCVYIYCELLILITIVIKKKVRAREYKNITSKQVDTGHPSKKRQYCLDVIQPAWYGFISLMRELLLTTICAYCLFITARTNTHSLTHTQFASRSNCEASQCATVTRLFWITPVACRVQRFQESTWTHSRLSHSVHTCCYCCRFVSLYFFYIIV